MQVSFVAAARAEANEARRYYESVAPALAHDFAVSLAGAIARVAKNPLMWPPLTVGSAVACSTAFRTH